MQLYSQLLKLQASRVGVVSSLMLVLALMSSCSKEELSGQSVLEHRTTQQSHGDLDSWIDNTFTQPYNISVDYRWDRYSLPLGTYATPPREDKVRAVLEMLKALWIDVYESDKVGGVGYLKGKAPLRLVLLGSSYTDGRGVQLVASPRETATELYVYGVNDFVAGSDDQVFVTMRSVLHQFTQHLTELYPYDRDAFVTISPEDYVSSTSDIAPLLKGNRRQQLEMYVGQIKVPFLTLYARLSPTSDFSETASTLILHKQADVTALLTRVKTLPAIEAGSVSEAADLEEAKAEAQRVSEGITRKIVFVEDYYKQKLNLSISGLRKAYQDALRKYKTTVSTTSTSNNE